MRHVRLTRLAREDISQIWDHLAADNARAADRLLERFDARFTALLRFPNAGMGRPDLGPGVRFIVEGPYLILYRVLPDIIQIVRILHGARDIAAINLDDLTD